MGYLLFFVRDLIVLYRWIVIADIVIGWLMQANIINPYQPAARAIAQGLHAVTEPALRPIRNLLPRSAGIDWSPFVLILICLFLEQVVIPNLIQIL